MRESLRPATINHIVSRTGMTMEEVLARINALSGGGYTKARIYNELMFGYGVRPSHVSRYHEDGMDMSGGRNFFEIPQR